MANRIFITGACGFIGHTMWNYIKSKFHDELYGIDIRKIYEESTIFKNDINDIDALKKILIEIKPQIIFHLAGGRFTDENDLYQGNYLTTKNLFDVIIQIPEYQPRVIIPGSAAEYGKMPDGMDSIAESVIPQPESAYGRVKFQQTELALSYVEKGVDVYIARIFNITGAGTSAALAAGRFAQQIVQIEEGKKKLIIQTKNLNGKRDFLDVKDVCEGLYLISQHGSSGEVYNVCSNKFVSIRTMLEKLISYSTVKNVSIDEDKDDSMPSFDVRGLNTKLKMITNWEPSVSLDQSLMETLQSYRTVYESINSA